YPLFNWDASTPQSNIPNISHSLGLGPDRYHRFTLHPARFPARFVFWSDICSASFCLRTEHKPGHILHTGPWDIAGDGSDPRARFDIQYGGVRWGTGQN